MRAKLIGGPNDGHVVENFSGLPTLLMPDPMTHSQVLKARIKVSEYKRAIPLSEEDPVPYYFQRTRKA